MHRTHAAAFLLAACCALLGACGRGDSGPAAATGGDAQEAPLPKPQAAGGSITGMPDAPGPGQAGPAVAGDAVADADAALDGDATAALQGDFAAPGALPLPPGDAPAAAQDAQAPAAAEPGAAEAVAVVQAYYAAISARQYPRAHALWSGGGQASGQDPQQFAAGFADTASVSVDVGAPGRVEGAAGSRYVEIPVAVAATRRDGSVHRYVGAYTLRRAVVDGATDEQRAWRIASADLREVRP